MKIELQDARCLADLTNIKGKMAHDPSFHNHIIGVWELADNKKSLKRLVRILILPRENWDNFTAVQESAASYVYYNFNLQKVKLSHLAPIDEREVSPSTTLDQVVEVQRKEIGVKNESK